VIANQSPPMTSMGRSASADQWQMTHDGGMLDDSMFLDMSSKQPMSLPFRNPMHEEQQHHPDMDMNAMVNFSTIDPSSLNPSSGM